MSDDDILFIPAGYKLCTHGPVMSSTPVDWSQEVVTIRFAEEAHWLAPGEICMVPMGRGEADG